MFWVIIEKEEVPTPVPFFSPAWGKNCFFQEQGEEIIMENVEK
jgi:hypothetical protein